ncbi:hypothetical protein BJ970_005379 [Saccharopolyspora phatthalungensis]|uniref:Uncharacterized protein n=1 Tax=Saccharopolyspora phatthalungensis TaxID=664693 RepID=A0A840QH22_9PSEU|nr:hypothetical protein [Saccharopolyspora phatthalungensis]
MTTHIHPLAVVAAPPVAGLKVGISKCGLPLLEPFGFELTAVFYAVREDPDMKVDTAQTARSQPHFINKAERKPPMMK